jgi:hypothetical protein
MDGELCWHQLLSARVALPVATVRTLALAAHRDRVSPGTIALWAPYPQCKRYVLLVPFVLQEQVHLPCVRKDFTLVEADSRMPHNASHVLLESIVNLLVLWMECQPSIVLEDTFALVVRPQPLPMI